MSSFLLKSPIVHLLKAVASGFYTGYLPKAPGSWGSFLCCLLLWFARPTAWYFQLPFIIAIWVIAEFTAGLAEHIYGHDDRHIVVDEFAGQAVALFMAPHSIIAFLLAFISFRIFDIVKLPPAREWEKLPGGRGVVADDMAAGLYAAVFLQMVIALLKGIGAEWIVL